MQGDECDWCGQTSYVIRVASYGKPLCEYCRLILDTENTGVRNKKLLAQRKPVRVCDWCGGNSNVKKPGVYGKPLCEFCRTILRTENKKAQKKRIRVRNRHSCFICGQKDGARKICGEPFCLCPEHRADFLEERSRKKKEQKNKEGRDHYRQRNSPGLKAARADRIVKYYCNVILKAKDLEPVCVDCGSKKDVVAIKTKRGLILLCADCRAKLYVRSETWKRATRWRKKKIS